MNRIITLGMPLLAVLSTAAVVRADCTTNAFRLGRDAAKQACDDIVGGYYPAPSYQAPVISGEATPERTCTLEDEVDCKNAMSQYTREHPACGDLIARNIPLYDQYSGEARGSAGETWRTYMRRSCAR